jgi:hypothetical protein
MEAITTTRQSVSGSTRPWRVRLAVDRVIASMSVSPEITATT